MFLSRFTPRFTSAAPHAFRKASLNTFAAFYQSTHEQFQEGPSSSNKVDSIQAYKNLRIFRKNSVMELANLFMINKLLHYSIFVNNADKLYRFSSKVFGNTITEGLIKGTMGKIFIGGSNIQEIKKFSDVLYSKNLPVIFDYCCEALDEDQNDKFMDDSAKIFEQSVIVGQDRPNHQISMKISGIIQMEVLKKLNKVAFSHKELYRTIDSQNKGYITAQEIIQELQKNHKQITEQDVRQFVEIVLELPTNGQSLENIRISNLLWRIRVHPYYFSTEKNNATISRIISNISAEEASVVEKSLKRIRLVLDSALKTKTRVLLDAEQSYIQLAIDSLIEQSQYIYNKDIPIVYNTFQNYLKSSRSRIEYEIAKHKEIGIPMGIKMVRGAYINEETRIAQENNTENPICESYEKTTEMIHGNLHLIVQNLSGKSELLLGSHNAQTVKYLQDCMKAKGIPNNTRQIMFAQLLGLADHLTYSILADGYSIYKYVPFGETHIMIPYLIRRAQESFQVLSSVELQYNLLKHEVSCRNPFKF